MERIQLSWMLIYVQVFPRTEIARSQGNTFLAIVDTLHIFYQCGLPIYILTRNCWEFQLLHVLHNTWNSGCDSHRILGISHYGCASISLITNIIKYLFMWLLPFKCIFMTLTHHFVLFFVFLVLICKTYYIVWNESFVEWCIANISTNSVAWPSPLIVYLMKISSKCSWITFLQLFVLLLVMLYYNHLILTLSSWKCSPLFSSLIFTILDFTFISTIHLKLIFVYGLCRVRVHFISIWIFNWPTTIYWKENHFPHWIVEVALS